MRDRDCAADAISRTLASTSTTPQGCAPAMTRTPTTFVTAIAIAARAFAGEFPFGAHFPGFVPGTPLTRP
jgi:hypothetical protein